MALDALTAPMPAPPVRQFSFTDWQVNNPTSPPPGDRLDAEFDRANGSITDTITWASVTLNSDGSLRDGSVGENALQPGLFDDVANDAMEQVQPLVDQAAGYASASQTNANTAIGASNAASAQAAAASGSATQAGVARTDAQNARDLAQGAATTAQNAAVDAGNAGNHADGAAALTDSYAIVAGAWAEYMPDPIPPNILAVMGITGDHWSSRWWANKAAGAFGALSALYMGALPSAPGSTPTGDPLPVGAIYYNTTTQQPYVWTGTQWVPFTTPAKAVVVGLLYQATAGQTVFDTNTPDLGGKTYPVTADPLEVYVNGVRIPQQNASSPGDWSNVNNVITFATPLAAGSTVMIDVLTADTSSGVLPGGPYLALAGGTMAGPLFLSGDATGALMPATKQQLDTKLPLAGGTLTGLLTLSGAPTSNLHAATKAYADTKLPLAGGTLTGLLTLSGAPTAANHAATKTYVDTNVATKLNLSGGTLTGPLILSGAPTTNLGAATKFYVDSAVALYLPLTGGVLTGALTLAGPPTNGLHAASKAYVDGAVSGAVANYLPLTGGNLTGNVVNTAEFQAPTFRLTGTSGYLFGNATVTQWVMDSSNWRWEYTRVSGDMTYRRGSDNVALFNISPSGTASAVALSAPSVTGSSGVFALSDNSFGLMTQAGASLRLLQFFPPDRYMMWNSATDDIIIHTLNGSLWNLRGADALAFNAVSAVGGNGAYVNISDERTKSDIGPSPYGLSHILQLAPVLFRRLKPDGTPGDRTEIGFGAQQVQPVIPEAVMVAGFPQPDTLAIMVDGLVAAVVNAIKELAARVAALEGARA